MVDEHGSTHTILITILYGYRYLVYAGYVF